MSAYASTRDDYAHYHRRSKLQSVFKAWRKAFEASIPQPVNKGVAVYAAFKWINLTLDERRRMPTEVYRFPRHLAKERDGTESTYFLSRIRDYVSRNLQVSAERLPYFVHAIALLDAYQMSQVFSRWKSYHLSIRRSCARSKRNYLRDLLIRWRRYILREQMVEDARIAVCLLRERRTLVTTFRRWRVIFKAFRRQRMHVIPSRQRAFLHAWQFNVGVRKMSIISTQSGAVYHVRRRVLLAWRVWLFHLCKLSKAASVLRSPELQQWILAYNKIVWSKGRFFQLEFVRQIAARSATMSHHPHVLYILLTHAPDLCATLPGSAHEQRTLNSHRPTVGFSEESKLPVRDEVRELVRLHQAVENLGKVLRVVRERPFSRITQRFLLQTADSHHRCRQQLRAFRLWILRIAQRSFDRSDDSLVEGRRSSPLRSRSSLMNERGQQRNARNLIQSPGVHFNDQNQLETPPSPFYGGSRHYKLRSPKHLASVPRKDSWMGSTTERKEVIYLLSRWQRRAHKLATLRQRQDIIHHRHRRRDTQRIFGSWIILTARTQSLRRAAHRVLNQRLRRDLYLAFFAWRNQYERCELIHRNERELLALRAQEIQSFKSLYTKKVEHKAQFTVLKAWALFVRDRSRGKRLLALWNRLGGGRLAVFSAFKHWQSFLYYDTIVRCWQKCWRGYRVRFLTHPQLMRYLQWYRRRIPSMFALRRTHLRMKGFRLLSTYRLQVRAQVIETRLLHQRKRLFRRWWQHYRRFKLIRRAQSLCDIHYQRHRLHMATQYLHRYAVRQRFVHRLVRSSRRGLARYAIAQLRFWSYLRRSYRYCAREATHKRLLECFRDRWRHMTVEAVRRRRRELRLRRYLLRPVLLQWFRYMQHRRWQHRRVTENMPQIKARLRLRVWQSKTQAKVATRSLVDHYHHRRLLRQYLRHAVWSLLLHPQSSAGRRRRRLRRAQQSGNYQSLLQGKYNYNQQQYLLKQRRASRRNAGNDSDSDVELTGRLNARTFKGIVSEYSRKYLRNWRLWALHRRQHRSFVTQRLHGQQRKKMATFMRALVANWRTYHQKRLAGQGTQVRRARQRLALTSKYRQGSHSNNGANSSNNHLRSLRYAHLRRDTDAQQRLVYKAYLKRAVIRRRDFFAADGPDDLRCELYGYLHRWIFFQVRHHRRQQLLREVTKDRHRHQLHVHFLHWTQQFCRRHRRERLQLHNITLRRQRRQLLLAFQRLRRRALRARKHRRALYHMEQVQLPKLLVYFAFHRLKRRQRIFHRTVVQRFVRLNRKWKRRMQHFLERLKLLVYHRRYAPPVRIVQVTSRDRLLLQFRKFRTLTQRHRLRQKMKHLLLHGRRSQLLHHVLQYWHRYARLKVALHRCTRRLSLVTPYKHWLRLTFETLHARKSIATVQQRVKRRIKRQIMHAWRLFAVHSQRMQLQHDVVHARYAQQVRRSFFLKWILVLDQQILFARFITIQAKHNLRVKKRCLRFWFHRARDSERITYQNALHGWRNWTRYIASHRLQAQKLRQGHSHFVLEHSLRQSLRRWHRVTQQQRYQRLLSAWNTPENPVFRRYLMQRYRVFFRRWKRFMFLQHYRGTHQQPSSTYRQAQSHRQQPDTSRSHYGSGSSKGRGRSVRWEQYDPAELLRELKSDARPEHRSNNNSSSHLQATRPYPVDTLSRSSRPTLGTLSEDLTWADHTSDDYKYRKQRSNATASVGALRFSHASVPVAPSGTSAVLPGRTKPRLGVFSDEEEEDTASHPPPVSPLRALSLSSMQSQRPRETDHMQLPPRRNASTTVMSSAPFSPPRRSSASPGRRTLPVDETSGAHTIRTSAQSNRPSRPQSMKKSMAAMRISSREAPAGLQMVRRHGQFTRGSSAGEEVPGTELGCLRNYTMARALLHWRRLARVALFERISLRNHCVLNAWRLHALRQRLLRQAFATRLTLWRRKHLYTSHFQPWLHVLRVNQRGQYLANSVRHQRLVQLTWRHWRWKQAHRQELRTRLSNVEILLRRYRLFPWAFRQWYVATHQCQSIGRHWVTRHAWQHWHQLLKARRFYKYRILYLVVHQWRRLHQQSRQRRLGSQRRYHLLHRLVHRHLLVRYQRALRRAWALWWRYAKHEFQKIQNSILSASSSSPAPSLLNSSNTSSLSEPALQTLCLSQAGQVILFRNLRPVALSTLLHVLPTQYGRAAPRAEIIRSALWARYVAPQETYDAQMRRQRDLQRRRYVQRIRMIDPSALSATEAATAGSATGTSGDPHHQYQSLRQRMSAVLTPRTQLQLPQGVSATFHPGGSLFATTTEDQLPSLSPRRVAHRSFFSGDSSSLAYTSSAGAAAGADEEDDEAVPEHDGDTMRRTSAPHHEPRHAGVMIAQQYLGMRRHMFAASASTPGNTNRTSTPIRRASSTPVSPIMSSILSPGSLVGREGRSVNWDIRDVRGGAAVSAPTSPAFRHHRQASLRRFFATSPQNRPTTSTTPNRSNRSPQRYAPTQNAGDPVYAPFSPTGVR